MVGKGDYEGCSKHVRKQVRWISHGEVVARDRNRRTVGRGMRVCGTERRNVRDGRTRAGRAAIWLVCQGRCEVC